MATKGVTKDVTEAQQRAIDWFAEKFYIGEPVPIHLARGISVTTLKILAERGVLSRTVQDGTIYYALMQPPGVSREAHATRLARAKWIAWLRAEATGLSEEQVWAGLSQASRNTCYRDAVGGGMT